LIVGGTASTVTTADLASPDFALTINHASNLGGFGITSLSYSVGEGNVFTARTTARVAATAVPEPATTLLLVVGIPAIVATRRRRSGARNA
jgi:hypothetical protein